jgi:hypothetical protein
MSYNCSAAPEVIPEEEQSYSQGRWVFVTFITIMMLASAVLMLGVFYWGKKKKRFERLRIRRMVVVYIPFTVLVLHSQVGYVQSEAG